MAETPSSTRGFGHHPNTRSPAGGPPNRKTLTSHGISLLEFHREVARPYPESDQATGPWCLGQYWDGGAGVLAFLKVTQGGLDVWRQVQAVNVESALLLTQAFVSEMQERDFGRVILIVSYSFLHPPAGT